jgi:ribose transport system substrate-binding protein
MSNKTMMFVIISLLLIALLATGCTAPTPTPEAAADRELVVGWSGAPLLDDFQFQLRDGIMGKAEELGVRVIHIEHDNDPTKQASDIEDLLAQNVDALLIAAANADAVVPSIDQAVERGVPVFTIDNAANSDKVLSHNGNDLFCIGYRSMEYLADQIGGEGKVLHINGFAGMALVEWNDDGVQAYLAENPGIDLVMTGYADWDPARALAITEDVLQVHPDLEGIYVIAEIMTPGPVQALRAMGLTDQVKLMSGGFAPESQELLESGGIIAALEWSAEGGAAEHMQSIYDYLVNGEQPPVFSPFPVYGHSADGETWQLSCPIGDWQP